MASLLRFGAGSSLDLPWIGRWKHASHHLRGVMLAQCGMRLIHEGRVLGIALLRVTLVLIAPGRWLRRCGGIGFASHAAPAAIAASAAPALLTAASSNRTL